jgi:hypothetical protein
MEDDDMKKTILPLAGALLLVIAPAYAFADDASTTRTEERVETNGGLGVGTQRSERSVETQHDSDDDERTTKSERKETVENDGLTTQHKVQKHTETETDD